MPVSSIRVWVAGYSIGTGIGLSIVKKIVDNHTGIITATSELNKGARFDIYIPVTEKIIEQAL